MYLCHHCHKTSERGEPLYRLPIIVPCMHPGNHRGKRAVSEMNLCPRCRAVLAEKEANGRPKGGQQ